jgi:hypothetical protein
VELYTISTPKPRRSMVNTKSHLSGATGPTLSMVLTVASGAKDPFVAD